MFKNNYCFFLPYCYFVKTRITGASKFLSWILIYFTPLFIISELYNSLNISSILQFIIITSVIYGAYEIGYIYNDTETIKKESKPTLRLSQDNLKFYYRYRWYIYSFRLLMIYTISFTMSIKLAVIVTLLLILFYVYNNIRNRFNLLLHFILVIFRYSMPVFMMTNSIILTMLSVICFPLINVIERCSEKRFGLVFFQKSFFEDKSKLRVIYYFISFSLMLLISTSYISIIYCLLYYFIYRLLVRVIYE